MIDLKHLSLDGWMSYDVADIDLSTEGITRIQGDIGAGKSAVLEAIYYLLFGKTFRGKDSVNSLINKILQGGYEISLSVAIDGVDYLIKEIRDRPNKGLYFYAGDTDNRGKTDPETRKKIVQTLGISHTDFCAIAFLGQRQSQHLVEGTPGERAKTLIDVFGLERYDDAIKDCKTDYEASKKELQSLEENLKTYQEEFSALEDSLTADYGEIDEGEYEKTGNDIDSKIHDVEERLSKITALSDKVKRTVYIFEAEEQQRNNAKKLNKEIKQLKGELDKLPKPERRKDLETRLRELQRNITTINNSLDDADNKISEAKKLTNTCPIISEECPVQIPKKHSALIIENCKSKKKKLSEEVAIYATDVQTCNTNLQSARYYAEIENKLNTKEESLAGIPKATSPEDIEEQKDKLTKYENSLAAGRDKLKQLQKKNLEIHSALAVAKNQKELLAKMEQAINAKEDAIEQLTQKVKNKVKENRYLYAAILVFNKIKMYKIDLVLELLNKYLDEILTEISSGEYKAEFASYKTSEDKKKTLDKVNITVYDSNKALPIELCSGGQSTEVGLAVLLATWKTANSISNKGVSSLWLDEVFGPLHENIINNVFDSVISVVSELGTNSIKIITHRDLDERLFDNFWYISIKDGISTIETEGVTNEGI